MIKSTLARTALVCWIAGITAAEESLRRPNILWLTSEDHGPQLGSYGDPNARTPNLDAMAARGLRYERVWSCAPVCAPARTTLITGLYATSLGAEHMRSLVPLPEQVRLLPQLLRDAGYYCANNSKEDYNVIAHGTVWDESSRKAHWRGRSKGQPFFAVFNHEASHESSIRQPGPTPVPASAMRVPAYHPDTPEIRQHWARYYAQVSAVDAAAGARLRELEADGHVEDTIVFYFADHGPGLSRCKRSALDSGLRVPLIVYIPERYRARAPDDYTAGAVSKRLVSFVDFAPTVLSLAGIPVPSWMQGVAFAGLQRGPAPEFLFGFRGRMDERSDCVRSATDGRWVYVRNYHLHRPRGQQVAYEFRADSTKAWRSLFQQGALNTETRRYWEVPRESEELYDLLSDPDEVHPLPDDGENAAQFRRFRDALHQHAMRIRDAGFLPESAVHRASGNRSPRVALADDAIYPLEELYEAADRAAALDSSDLPALVRDLSSDVAGLRYWATMGLLSRGSNAVTSARESLIKCAQDPEPFVRIPAAECLARYGTDDDRTLALNQLITLADPAGAGGYAAVEAYEALDACAIKDTALLSRIRALPDKSGDLPVRMRDALPRLRSHF